MKPKYLRPFWHYYGGKWRAAPKYPKPRHSRIIEPFAGAAGYSLRYYDRNVVLYEKYSVIAEMWRYLIDVRAWEIRAIPSVDHVDDLPAWVPEGGRALVGFTMNEATTAPCNKLSSGSKKLREKGSRFQGWSEAMRERVASQVEHIRHWVVVEGDYSDCFNFEATWFIDPPYQKTGKYYIHGSNAIDYDELGAWCHSRRGQVIVCENEGAEWLPFKSFAYLRSASNMSGGSGVSKEVIWEGGTCAPTWEMLR